MAAAGVVTSYAATIACILLSGLGVAAFHPESARYANYSSGEKRATGMSVFSVGGNVGVALGPAAITALAASGGLSRVVWMALPAALMAALLVRELPRLSQLRPSLPLSRAAVPAGEARWGDFGKLGLVVVVRSLLSFGLMSFVPLYLMRVRGVPKGRASLALTVMLLAGAAATLAGGRLADRIGRRAVLLGSLVPIAPLILLFLKLSGPASILCLALIGAGTVASYSVAVVMGQEYLPGREGIAGGVTMGLAIGLGGAGVPILGLVADHWGIGAVLPTLAVLPLIAGAVGLALPADEPRPAGRAPSTEALTPAGPTGA